MKNLLLLFMILSVNLIFAQDLVILKNGDEINVKVVEVHDNGIKYKKSDFLEGPLYNLKNSKIFLIKYSNGEKVVISNDKSSENSENKQNQIYYEIEEGTNVPLYVARTISSKSISVGSVIELRVKDAVVDEDNHILIRANQLVYATVNSAQHAKGLGKQGELNIMIEHIKGIDGTKIPAYLNLGNKGKDRSGAAWGVGLFLFWPALFLKGKEAELKAGTIINSQISENREILINEKYKSSSTKSLTSPIQDPKNENITPVDCGEKPWYKGSRQPGYKQNKQYKDYRRVLKSWQKCMQEN